MKKTGLEAELVLVSWIKKKRFTISNYVEEIYINCYFQGALRRVIESRVRVLGSKLD